MTNIDAQDSGTTTYAYDNHSNEDNKKAFSWKKDVNDQTKHDFYLYNVHNLETHEQKQLIVRIEKLRNTKEESTPSQ